MKRQILNIPLLLLLISFSVHAQEKNTMQPSQNYPFLNLQYNRFFLPDSVSDKFAVLREKMVLLRSSGDKNLHILQLGDSHIQADYLTGAARNRLVNVLQCPLAGRGTIFPFQYAGTNNPENYRFYTYNHWEADRSVLRNSREESALAGVTVFTSDTLIRIRFKLLEYDAPLSPFTHLCLYYNASCPVTKAVAANMVTDSMYFSANGISSISMHSDKMLDSADIILHCTREKNELFFFHGISLSNNHPGIIYSALGSNGASAASYLRSKRMPDQLKLLQPDVLILSLGTNDAYERPFDLNLFKQQYDSLLNIIEKEFPHLPLILTTPGDSWHKDHKTNPFIAEVREEILRLASAHGCAVWDLHAIMGGSGVINKWYNEGLARKDRVHLSKQGYSLLGGLLSQAWGDFFNQPMSAE